MNAAEQSRGFRNRNPGNIDYVPANKWQGQTGLGDLWLPASQRRFAAFESHEFGIRALAALLTTYQDRHQLRSITQIISRWAPAADRNNTAAYITFVARRMGRGPNDVLDLHTYADARPLVEAIIAKELGGQPYADAVLDEGLRRAGVVKPVASVREAAATGTGRGATTIATVAAVATPAATVVTSLGSLPQWTGVVLVLAVLVVALAWVLTQRRGRAA